MNGNFAQLAFTKAALWFGRGSLPPLRRQDFPAAGRVPELRRRGQDPFAFSGKGEVYSYTTVYDAPEGYEGNAPYTVAIVKLEEGPMVTAQLTDVDNGKVSIGQSVEMVTRKLREDGDQGHAGLRV